MRFPEQYRYSKGDDKWVTKPGQPYGYFHIPGPAARGRPLRCLACASTSAIQWDHVSVSLQGWEHKTPSWEEMCLVKDLFWTEDQWVVQYHPPKSVAVNLHPGCLHLWHPTSQIFPLTTPPRECV